MAEFTPHWHQPSHPDRLKVVKGEEPFTAGAFSLISLPPGALFAKMTGAAEADRITYTSAAYGTNRHLEFNSDLVYCNHSCDPSLIFDFERFEVRVADDRPLNEGDALTWFYPSSEWLMVQPFWCRCGADKCLGWISGASQIDLNTLNNYWLNRHVLQSVKQREQSAKTNLNVGCEVQHGINGLSRLSAHFGE